MSGSFVMATSGDLVNLARYDGVTVAPVEVDGGRVEFEVRAIRAGGHEVIGLSRWANATSARGEVHRLGTRLAAVAPPAWATS